MCSRISILMQQAFILLQQAFILMQLAFIIMQMTLKGVSSVKFLMITSLDWTPLTYKKIFFHSQM